MYYELESGTDAAQHAIYDPAAISHLKFDTDDGDPYTALYEDEPRKGNVLVYSEASDGSTLFRVYVDENLPADWAQIAPATHTNLLLRVPSGTLVASGVEYVNDQREIDAAKPYTPERYAMTTKINIPPGNYLVDTYEFSWDWNKDIEPEIRREMGSSYWLHKILGTLTGLGCMASALSLAWVVITLINNRVSNRDWLWFWLSIGLLVVSSILMKLAIPKSYWSQKKKIAARFPANVLIMKRLPDGADLSNYQGGGFGSAV